MRIVNISNTFDADGFAHITLLDEFDRDISLVMARLRPEKIVRSKWKTEISEDGVTCKYRTVTSSHHKLEYVEFATYYCRGKKIKVAKCNLEFLYLVKAYRWIWESRRAIVAYKTSDETTTVRLNFRHVVAQAKDGQHTYCRNKDTSDLRKFNVGIVGAYTRTFAKAKVTASVVNIVKREEHFHDGLPSGSISTRESHRFIVAFTNPGHQKSFLIAHYKTKADCRAAADAYRYRISSERGTVRNKYRYVWTDDGTKLLEVEAVEDITYALTTFLCNIQDLELVKSRAWRIDNEGYVVASYSVRFHRCILPDCDEVDHINGNRKDNRRINLRDGSAGVNHRNRGISRNNASGTTGVWFNQTKNAWAAAWTELNGKRKVRNFAVDAHGAEEAKQLAIKTRQEANERLNLDVSQTV